MYYNTNKESGETLTSSQAKTQSQEDCVLSYFRGGTYTFSAPHDMEFLFAYKVPITSIRRADLEYAKEALEDLQRVINKPNTNFKYFYFEDEEILDRFIKIKMAAL